jgi:hypothetical protein
MTNNRFDNNYITRKFHEIDEQRLNMDKETILPLSRKERNKYIEITSLKLIKTERQKLFKSGLFLLTSTFHVATFLVADYALFWVLALINYHAHQSYGVYEECKLDRNLGMNTCMIYLFQMNISK